MAQESGGVRVAYNAGAFRDSLAVRQGVNVLCCNTDTKRRSCVACARTASVFKC
jgi:hypothetical protein